MKRQLPLLLLALFSLLALSPARAQAPTVRITVLLVPPYSTHLADYVDQPNRLLVSVTNMGRVPVELQLAGNLSNDDNIRMYTKPGYRSPRSFDLAGGQTRSLTQDELRDLFDAGSLVYQGIKAEEIVRGNGLPEGAYTICVRALDYKTQRLLSADAPGGCSRPAMIRTLEAPYIIKPAPEAVITTIKPQNIIFSWSRPVGAPPATEYEFRIVELSNNRRNINDAFLSGTTPPLYERTVRGAPVLLYGPAEPALIPGRRYAFAVTAIDPRGQAVFKNNGRSEVQSFIFGSGVVQYASNTTNTNITIPVPPKMPPPKPPVAQMPPPKPVHTVGNNSGLTVTNLFPISVIRGRMQWSFRASEEKSSMLEITTGGLPFFGDVSGEVAGIMSDPSSGPASVKFMQNATSTAYQAAASAAAIIAGGGSLPPGPKGSPGGLHYGGLGDYSSSGPIAATSANPLTSSTASGSVQRVALVSGGGETSGLSFGGGVKLGVSGDKNYSTPKDNIPQLGKAPTQEPLAIPPLMGKQHYPLANVHVRVMADYRPIAPNQFGYTDPVLNALHSELIGMGTTTATGDFEVSFINPNQNDDPTGPPRLLLGGKNRLVVAVRLELEDPHFISEPVAYLLPPAKAGVYDLGTVESLANTFRLKALATSDGKPITTPVRVELFRPVVWYGDYPYASHEGELPEAKRPVEALFGDFSKITDVGKSGGQLVRLFANSAQWDHYWARISAEGYNTLLTIVQAKPPTTTPESGVMLLTKTYSLTASPPQVRGSVLRKHDNSPVAGASVRLYRGPTDKPDWQFNTQTDAKGCFVFQLIGPNPSTWKVSVSGAGILASPEVGGIKVNKTGPAGIVKLAPILIDASVHPVVGRVLSDEGGGLAEANLLWKSGGEPFKADNLGRFLSTHQAGPDTLIISKVGFKTLRAGVWVNGDGLANPATGKSGTTTYFLLGGIGSTPAGFSGASNGLGKFLTSAASLQVPGEPGFQMPGTGQGSQSSQLMYQGGFATDKNALNSYLKALKASEDKPLGDGQDLGTFTLLKLVARLRVTVRGADGGKLLPGATVTFPNTTPVLSLTTETDGQAYFKKAPGGPVDLRITGPTGGPLAYVPHLLSANLPADGSTIDLNVTLEPGSKVSGTVTAAGKPVPGAKVAVAGRPDMVATAQANGQYELIGVPKGAQSLLATKSGFIGQSQPKTLVPGQNATVDFVLGSAGFAIDKLLGFPIEVTTLTKGADTTLVGSFVNLTGNTVFAVKSDVRLAFTAKVRLGKNGVLRPKGKDFIETDAPELALTAFGFLPVSLSEPGGLVKLKMRNNDPTKGQIVGAVRAKFGTLGNNLGWAWGEGVKTYLSDAAGTGPIPTLPALMSDGALPQPATALHLRGQGPLVNFSLYSFGATVDLTKSTVGTDGLHLAGSMSLAGVPGLGSAKINVTDLWIAANGGIKNASLGFSPPVAVSIGGFGFSLTGGSLSEVGLKLNGDVKVTVPGSTPSTVLFSDLSVSKTQIFGGSFVLPADGIDVFGLAKFKPVDGSPLAFGSLPGGPSFFSGGASTRLDLIDKDLTVESFTVQSDGLFAATIPTDYDADFAGLATLHLSSIGFKTVGGFGIDVVGNVLLDLPLVKAEIGTLRYRPGQTPTLKDVGLHIPIGVGTLGGKVSFLNNGFGGELDLNIVQVLNVHAGFNYQKINGSAAFDAKIVVGVGAIPIGPGLALTSLGGGLSYGDGALKSVTLSGAVSVAGFEAGLALNPIDVTVSAGPVIIGTADLTVFDQKMAHANLTLDFPQSLASMQIKTDYNPLPAVGTASAGGVIVACGKAGDSYWVLGLAAQAKLLGLLDVNANILVGQNLNLAKHPELDYYTNFIDKNFLTDNTTVNGAHLQGMSMFGRHKEDAFNKCFWKACGKIWYYSESMANLNSNFKSGIYGLGIASGWGGGAELTIAGKSIAGADVGAQGALAGLYDNSQGWNVHGNVGAHLTAWLGDCGEACSNKICWGGCFKACILGCRVCPIPVGIKVCVKPSIIVNYTSNTGMDLGLDI